MTFNGKSLISCGHAGGDSFRRLYFEALEKYISDAENSAYSKREVFMPCKKLKADPEYYRKKYIEMIGQPVSEYPSDIPIATVEKFGEDDFGEYSYVSVEVLKSLPFFGILHMPKMRADSGKIPLIIAQHGGGGLAESCSDMCSENNYSNFTKRILEKGMAVFTPQLMLWNFDTVKLDEKFPAIDVPNKRKEFDGRLRSLGLTMTGLEVFCIRRCLDYLLSSDLFDDNRVGMLGLSYGGYFSLYTAAADLRIKAAYDAAAFNDRNAECFYDWAYNDMHNRFHDAEVAGLVAPRPLFIDVGKDDAVFHYETALQEAERVKKYYKAYDKDNNFSFNLWDGGHKFDVEGINFNSFLELFK
ncbi:MAG: hypothetical protein SPL89_08760 [Clostridia bacterium]|nr:hypothetical protein [Clostridia bacterium]